MTDEPKSSLVLLRIAGTNPPIYIIDDKWDIARDDPEVSEGLIESKLCPSDVIGVLAVIEGNDTDPHGVFEFVQAVERPADWPWVGRCTIERYKALFDKLETEVDLTLDSDHWRPSAPGMTKKEALAHIDAIDGFLGGMSDG